MEELESEVAERLQCLRRKVNTDCRRSQSDELLKCRQDINSLIRIVQNAYHNDAWDFQGEVAEKHDEIQALKRQVVCMEDEMQNAQKKIQLKKEIIKELRSDLKCTNAKLVSRSCLQANLDMAPVNLENQTVARSDAAQSPECSALAVSDDLKKKAARHFVNFIIFVKLFKTRYL
uniref:Uncharacterized protein n=1 Tax=Glossina pallidipes TaxID=7398 RepID=A0A1B0AB75_GLOPL